MAGKQQPQAYKNTHQPVGGATPVDINPGAAVYAMFPNFNYKAWTSIAEFVDNSVSSMMEHKLRLEGASRSNYKLKVSIDYSDQNRSLVVSDNAAGISAARFKDAFALAKPPEELSYISQHGVGMKAAACWFAADWTVCTSALGEDVERTLYWNTNDIVANQIQRLTPEVRGAAAQEHYTIVSLSNLLKPIAPMTLKKCRTYIANIYRKFIEAEQMEILFDGEPLEVSSREILDKPFWTDPSGANIFWSREFSIRTRSKKTIKGSAFILNTMDRQFTALNLFWHNRLIRGNFDPFYRPEELFGSINGAKSGRLYVELHLDDFKPTIDKQGFSFDGNNSSEEEIVALTRAELSKKEFNLLDQAARWTKEKLTFSDEIISEVKSVVRDLEGPVAAVIANPSQPIASNPYPPPDIGLEVVAEETMESIIDGRNWKITLQIVNRHTSSEFIDIREIVPATDAEPEKIIVSLNYEHPFIRLNWFEETREPIMKITMALAFGEVAARRAGAKYPTFVRRNMDVLLRRIAQQMKGS